MILCRPVPCNRRQRPQGSAAAAWTPFSLTGLAWAVDADPAYQWQDTAQTTPADDSGEPIRRLVAKYGAAILLDAPSDSARPTYSTSVFSGSQLFDGGNDWLRATHAGITGARSYGFRFAYVGGTYGSCLYTDRESGGTGTQVRIYTSTRLMIQIGVGTTTTASVGVTIPTIGTGAHTLILTWDGVSVTAASSYVVEWDGSPITATAETGTSVNGITAGTVHLGCFGNASGAIFFPGHLRRALHGSGVWGSTDKAEIRTWLEAA